MKYKIKCTLKLNYADNMKQIIVSQNIQIYNEMFQLLYWVIIYIYIYINAVKLLIVINCIQDTSFGVLCVFMYI